MLCDVINDPFVPRPGELYSIPNGPLSNFQVRKLRRTCVLKNCWRRQAGCEESRVPATPLPLSPVHSPHARS